jgi:hypothetical protein
MVTQVRSKSSVSVHTTSLYRVDVMRQLERKLEAVLERTAGQFFRGSPHVSELAGSIVRVLDLSVDTKGLVPNRILMPATVQLPDESLRGLEQAIAESVLERGWRIEGPITVIPSDVRTVTVTIERGDLPPWGVLRGNPDVPLTVNRSVIGRSRSCDVVLDDPSVSREHARMWCQDGRVLCVDLGSSNGTKVDDRPVGTSPVAVEQGSAVAFGAATFRFARTQGA